MEKVLGTLNEGKTIIFLSEELADAVELIQNLIPKIDLKGDLISFGSLYKKFLTRKEEMVKALSTSEVLIIPDITEIRDREFWKLLGIMLNSRIIEKKPTIIGTNLNIGNTPTPLLVLDSMHYYFDTSLIERQASIIPIEAPEIPTEETSETPEIDIDLDDLDKENNKKEQKIDVLIEFDEEEK